MKLFLKQKVHQLFYRTWVMWYLVSYHPLKGADGRVTGVSTVVQDITYRKHMEEDLRESQERYRTLFESSPHPMWVYDDDTLHFIEVNDAAISRYGFSRPEFLSMKIDEICCEPPREDSGEYDVPEGFEQDPGIWCHRTKAGEHFWALTLRKPPTGTPGRRGRPRPWPTSPLPAPPDLPLWIPSLPQKPACAGPPSPW